MDKDVRNVNAEDDLANFFDNFIKRGMVIKEKEIIPGFKVKLKVLNTGELFSAEALINTNSNIPDDIIQKVRCASILSKAIIEIGGIPVEKESDTSEENGKRRYVLYQKLLDTSSFVVSKAYDLYIEAVAEQNELYSNPTKAQEKIENF